MPDGSVAVWGTGICDLGGEGVNPEGGVGFLAVCELDMSDPRVSGTETQDRFRFIVGRAGTMAVWVAEEAHITSAEGSWRGSAQGVDSPDGVPVGEAHYVGEGAYEGLEFHYYFFPNEAARGDLEDDPIELHGWILPTATSPTG